MRFPMNSINLLSANHIINRKNDTYIITKKIRQIEKYKIIMIQMKNSNNINNIIY